MVATAFDRQVADLCPGSTVESENSFDTCPAGSYSPSSNVSCSLCRAGRYSTASGKYISISISKFNSEVSGSVFFCILFCWQCVVSCGVLH